MIVLLWASWIRINSKTCLTRWQKAGCDLRTGSVVIGRWASLACEARRVTLLVSAPGSANPQRIHSWVASSCHRPTQDSFSTDVPKPVLVDNWGRPWVSWDLAQTLDQAMCGREARKFWRAQALVEEGLTTLPPLRIETVPLQGCRPPKTQRVTSWIIVSLPLTRLVVLQSQLTASLTASV